MIKYRNIVLYRCIVLQGIEEKYYKHPKAFIYQNVHHNSQYKGNHIQFLFFGQNRPKTEKYNKIVGLSVPVDYCILSRTQNLEPRNSHSETKVKLLSFLNNNNSIYFAAGSFRLCMFYVLYFSLANLFFFLCTKPVTKTDKLINMLRGQRNTLSQSVAVFVFVALCQHPRCVLPVNDS